MVNVTRTVCALAPSHYQQDIIHSWLEKWGDNLHKKVVQLPDTGAMDVWEVEGPQEAFDELPKDVFAKKYRRALRDHLSAEAFK